MRGRYPASKDTRQEIQHGCKALAYVSRSSQSRAIHCACYECNGLFTGHDQYSARIHPSREVTQVPPISVSWPAYQVSVRTLESTFRTSYCSPSVVEASVLTWRFPKLQMFGVSGTLENPKLNAEIAALLFSHAATVEEVELRHFFIIDEVARAVEWKRFTMLKKLHLLNLGTIHHLIPALYGDSSAASSRPLVIHFAAAWIGNEVVGMFNHAIRSHLHAFAQVTFLLDEFAWDDITRAFSWHRAGRMTCLLSPSLETASLAIFDKNGEPLDSPAALRCRQALIKVEAGL